MQTGGARPVGGADGTYVKVRGEQVGIEVVVDDHRGELLGLAIITSEASTEILELIEEVVDLVHGEVLVSDDHGAYREVADTIGTAHQIWRSHAQRNVADLADSLRQQLAHSPAPPANGELPPEQMQADLETLQELIRARPADAEEQLAAMYDRYKAVPVPPPSTRHSVWYRMRLMVTRLENRWRNLTLDLRRDDLDGPNNTCERLIGWWLKERYRPRREYKRQESIKNVVSLTALLGADPGYYDMTTLLA